MRKATYLHGLPPRQAKFVAEYLISDNATAAAAKAGYSAKTADQQGSRMLKNIKVAEAIAAGRKRTEVETDITKRRVLDEVALLAFSDAILHYDVDDMGRVVLTPEAPPGATRAISSVKYRTKTDAEGAVTREVELKLWDKPSTVKLAGRHVGLFPDKVEVEFDLSKAPDSVLDWLMANGAGK